MLKQLHSRKKIPFEYVLVFILTEAFFLFVLAFFSERINKFNQPLSTAKPSNNWHATYLKPNLSKLPQQLLENQVLLRRGVCKWVQIMSQPHQETAVWKRWERKVDWQGSVDSFGVLFSAGEEEPVKGLAMGEKETSHGPLCMNAPASRPASLLTHSHYPGSSALIQWESLCLFLHLFLSASVLLWLICFPFRCIWLSIISEEVWRLLQFFMHMWIVESSYFTFFNSIKRRCFSTTHDTFLIAALRVCRCRKVGSAYYGINFKSRSVREIPFLSLRDLPF